jgi:hypothetical protein
MQKLNNPLGPGTLLRFSAIVTEKLNSPPGAATLLRFAAG